MGESEGGDDDSGSLVPRRSSGELQPFIAMIREAVEQQATAQAEVARVEAVTQRHQITEESKLIERDQVNGHSRFKHAFWGIVGFCAVFFCLAVALIFTDRDQAGFLVITHLFTLLIGAFGGRALPKAKDDDD